MAGLDYLISQGETPEDLIRMLGWEESGMMRQGVKSEVYKTGGETLMAPFFLFGFIL